MGTTPSVQLDIYNMALGYIGVAPVQNTNDGSTPCNVCNQFWNAAVRDTQRSCPWGFNTVILTLNQNSAFPIVNNWAYAYTYPASGGPLPECLRIWKIQSPATSAGIVGIFPGIYPNTQISNWSGWNMQGAKHQIVYDSVNDAKVILCNVNQAIAVYATPVFDTTMFDGVFVQAVTLSLASLIATSLVNDDTKTGAILKLYAAKISDAMRMNAEEDNQDKNAERSAFLDARGGGGAVSPQFWNSPSTSQY